MPSHTTMKVRERVQQTRKQHSQVQKKLAQLKKQKVQQQKQHQKQRSKLQRTHKKQRIVLDKEAKKQRNTLRRLRKQLRKTMKGGAEKFIVTKKSSGCYKVDPEGTMEENRRTNIGNKKNIAQRGLDFLTGKTHREVNPVLSPAKPQAQRLEAGKSGEAAQQPPPVAKGSETPEAVAGVSTPGGENE